MHCLFFHHFCRIISFACLNVNLYVHCMPCLSVLFCFVSRKASVNAFMGTMVNLRRLLDEAASSISSLHGGDSTGVSGGSSAASSSFSVQMHWKVHSMGSHLMLGLVERAHWAKEPLSKLFAKVILDAPDVPTWEFRERVSRLAVAGVHVLHLFNPFDQVEVIACVLFFLSFSDFSSSSFYPFQIRQWHSSPQALPQ